MGLNMKSQRLKFKIFLSGSHHQKNIRGYKNDTDPTGATKISPYMTPCVAPWRVQTYIQYLHFSP